MRDNNYYTIHGWMINRLKLSGNELILYAVIYGFSQVEDCDFRGSLNYLKDCINASVPTVIKAINSLKEKGFIDKEEVEIKKVKRCIYKVTKESLEGGTKESLEGGTKDTCNNNKDIDINNKKNRLSNDNQKKEYSNDFISFWSLYHNGGKQQAYKAWNKLSAGEKQKAINLVDDYLKYCKYKGRTIKDTSSYLNQKGFNEDWLATPEYYVVQDTDNERVTKFKRYMADNHQALIFHRNPLTFEQANECIEKFTFSQTEWAMNKLKQRDIHQYFSIAKGIEAIVSDNSDFEDLED